MTKARKAAETYTHTDKFCLANFFQIILISICILFSASVFATGIGATNGSADPATCDAGTLGTDTGPANLRAEFTPENINLKWYNENTQINVASTSNTCTYDTPISLPANPTKPGYAFKGWKIRLKYDFSTLNTTSSSLHRYGKDKSGNTDICRYNETFVECNSSFGDLNQNQWKTIFDWGTIYGDAKCSATSGTYAVAGTPVNDSGQYCWCQATAYKNGNNWYDPSSALPWVYVDNLQNAVVCAYNCARFCAEYIQYGGFRRAAFGVTQ